MPIDMTYNPNDPKFWEVAQRVFVDWSDDDMDHCAALGISPELWVVGNAESCSLQMRVGQQGEQCRSATYYGPNDRGVPDVGILVVLVRAKLRRDAASTAAQA